MEERDNVQCLVLLWLLLLALTSYYCGVSQNFGKAAYKSEHIEDFVHSIDVKVVVVVKSAID